MPAGVLTIEDFLGGFDAPETVSVPVMREPEPEPAEKTALLPWEDPEIKAVLSNWCFCYTVSRSGGHSGIHFMMSRCDAMRWCSSPLIRGVIHGGRWAYFFTSVFNFCFGPTMQYREPKEYKAIIDKREIHDNGQWDDKIAGLGLKKYNFLEMRRILEPYGIIIPRDYRH